MQGYMERRKKRNKERERDVEYRLKWLFDNVVRRRCGRSEVLQYTSEFLIIIRLLWLLLWENARKMISICIPMNKVMNNLLIFIQFWKIQRWSHIFTTRKACTYRAMGSFKLIHVKLISFSCQLYNANIIFSRTSVVLVRHGIIIIRFSLSFSHYFIPN